MGVAYKNFWSLNTDEVVVTGMLRQYFNHNAEVFMPINAQCKDIDLILMDMNTRKNVTLQVKGSRAFEPRATETQKYLEGSAGWFFFKKETILNATADYFIFLIYIIEYSNKTGRRFLVPHTITIATKKLKELCQKYKKIVKGERYNLIFWINPKTKRVFDIKDNKLDLSEYLDNNGLEILSRELK